MTLHASLAEFEEVRKRTDLKHAVLEREFFALPELTEGERLTPAGGFTAPSLAPSLAPCHP
jgi:hypothetical protein